MHIIIHSHESWAENTFIRIDCFSQEGTINSSSVTVNVDGILSLHF